MDVGAGQDARDWFHQTVIRERSSSRPLEMDSVPAGLVDAVLTILRSQPGPMRRRKILGALEARGHRISLAGLNRILEQCVRNQLVSDGPDGIRPTPPV